MLERLVASPLSLTEKLQQNIHSCGKCSRAIKIKETSQYPNDWQATWDSMLQAKLAKK
ncbi:hypothetical protein CPAR01_00835 [Colletotrichum paranaense]|uniref:Uncharacterized protein n=1 Tax=Colletotrichum paranaense TaxID=1914294 RepID=A0ABQ9T516_9PEZI|nr:uncharacterized protein CPAR01_00835 [Colletotrichum paranaense]KAK1546868.1 hypothetical protein CPAR01_00835 [Colletotrichum paranaense]